MINAFQDCTVFKGICKEMGPWEINSTEELCELRA